MKKIRLKLVIFISILTLFIGLFSATTINAYASDIRNVSYVLEEYSDEILGKAENSTQVSNSQIISATSKNEFTVSNILPNNVVLDWVATESSIILYITNLGLDSVDVVGGTIYTGNMTQSFSCVGIAPGRRTHSVNVPIKSCHEDITINWWAQDGSSIGRTTSTGSRDIPVSLLNLWSPGSFGSKSACLNYHYRAHGAEIGATNICLYVRLADAFRTVTIPSQGLQIIRSVPGPTPNVYRYENSIYYLHVVCIGDQPIGDLVSFGIKW